MFEIIVEKEGLEFLGWRDVPTFPNVLGKKAVDCMPYIMQGFVKRPANAAKGIEFDRRLYVARRVFEQTAEDTTYVCSLSSMREVTEESLPSDKEAHASAAPRKTADRALIKEPIVFMIHLADITESKPEYRLTQRASCVNTK